MQPVPQQTRAELLDTMAVSFVRIGGLAKNREGDTLEIEVPRSIGTIPGTLEPPFEHPDLGTMYRPEERERILSRLTAWQMSRMCGIRPSIKEPPIHTSEMSETTVKDEGKEEEEYKVKEVYGAWVYEAVEAEVISGDLSSGRPPRCLPPLVLKVAPRVMGRNLAREGCAYGLAEDLQGRIFPRCYGYFTCKVDLEETTILPWGTPPKYMSDSKASPQILLLEKVGKCISCIDPRLLDGVRDELLAMVEEMAQFGVHCSDIKVTDILQADCGEDSPEPRNADVAKGTYTVRFIDLEYAGFPLEPRRQYKPLMVAGVVAALREARDSPREDDDSDGDESDGTD